MTATDSTSRFSNRVDDYVKYRPHYPAAIIGFLKDQYHLTSDKTVADIGAGTGISTELFLHAGYHVTAVEPNKEMRDKCIELLGDFPRFASTDGTAEDTRIDAATVDAIIAGQAFHWFDVPKAKEEFKRILKLDGIVVLMWNERKVESDFEKEYDQLIINHARDYVKVDHRNIDMEHIVTFFHPNAVQLQIFVNEQVFDFEGLKGRLLSSSYMPTVHDNGYEPMITDLTALFEKHKTNGTITVTYDTKVYVGKLK